MTNYDCGDPEPVGVIQVGDYTEDGYHLEDDDSFLWGRTKSDWKGYKNGGKVYLDWEELLRRWGPVRSTMTEETHD